MSEYISRNYVAFGEDEDGNEVVVLVDSEGQVEIVDE